MTEREFAIDVVKQLQGAGYQALWAGGCVRDELLGLVPKDYDVATDARPETVRQLFRRTLAVGASFGVIVVLGPRQDGQPLQVEVATFRTDVGYSDGRRPDQVVFASDREDALRRDFTINGMFYDPIKGHVVDYVDGRADLHAHILRAIGDPALRFQEDKLRLLRAVRIATRFELAIEPATETAIKAMASELPIVSAERIAQELRQLLIHPRRMHGVRLLIKLGLANAIFPGLAPFSGERTDHALCALDLLGPSASFSLALAALLLRVDEKGVDEAIAMRLKLSNAERERIVWLVEHQQALVSARQLRLSRLKMLLANDGIDELFALHRADALADDKDIDHVEYCEQLLHEWTPLDLNPPPLVTGADLKGRHLPPGPIYKPLLDAVREAQLDGTIHTREEALALLEKLISERTGS
jgi:poly(A) polymerase